MDGVIVQVIVKPGKIQDADVDTFSEFFVGIPFFQLTGKHFAQIEQNSGVPILEELYLHFQVQVPPIPHPDMDVQNSQFFFGIITGEFRWDDFSILNFVRGKIQ